MTLGRCLIGLDKDTSLKLYMRAQRLKYGIVLLQYQLRWAASIPPTRCPKGKQFYQVRHLIVFRASGDELIEVKVASM